MEQPQQLTPSLTEPRPPSGETPTQPPLSLSAQVGTAVSEVSRVKEIGYNFLDGYPIYLPSKSFVIETTTARNHLLMSWTLKDLFKSIDQINKIPFQLRDVIFHRRFNASVELILVPIKIGDTPCSIDIFTTYDSEEVTQTENTIYNKDYIEKTITDTEPFSVPYPMFWIADQVMTYYRNGLEPMYAPRTRITMRMKNIYNPTALHPPFFKVLAFARFNFNNTEKYAPTIPFGGKLKEFWLNPDLQ